MTYADIFSAVEADFAAALAKLGHDGMWFASFGEVWVGYEAYDATQWHSRDAAREPPDGGDNRIRIRPTIDPTVGRPNL